MTDLDRERDAHPVVLFDEHRLQVRRGVRDRVTPAHGHAVFFEDRFGKRRVVWNLDADGAVALARGVLFGLGLGDFLHTLTERVKGASQ